MTGVPLTKGLALRAAALHLNELGTIDRERLTALIQSIEDDGRIRLSNALNIVSSVAYDSSETAGDAALAAFRQFRLRIKNISEANNTELLLRSDTQKRSAPDKRWCWFEGPNAYHEEAAHFSDDETDFIYNIKHIIKQTAITIQLDSLIADPEKTLPLPNRTSTNSTTPRTHQKKFVSPTPTHTLPQHDILELLEEWVVERTHPYCALLGELGMGKTTACMRLTKDLLEKRKTDPSIPLPIYLDLRNFGEKVKTEELALITIIEMLLKNRIHSHTESHLEAQEVIRIVQEEHGLVIFDGLDEVLVHLPFSEGQRLVRKLLSIIPPKLIHKRPPSLGMVLLTCRTHFFRNLREQTALFTADDRIGITARDYKALVIQPVSPQQIREYLAETLPPPLVSRSLSLLGSVYNLAGLAERPYILSLIPAIFPQIEKWAEGHQTQISSATLYRHIILSWLERDTGKHIFNPEHKQQLMEHFSIELWKSGKQSLSIEHIEDWLIAFLQNHPEMEAHYTLFQEKNLFSTTLEMLKEDFRTATFLIRTGDAHFRFAHISLHEFFVAMYLHRALSEQRIQDLDMPLVSEETLDFLGQLIEESQSEDILTSLKSIRDFYQPRISELTFAYMLHAFKKGYPCPSLSGLKMDGADLNNWIISGIKSPDSLIPQPLQLRSASFKNAQLNNVKFRYAHLDSADFSGAYMHRTEFIEGRAQQALFCGTHLEGAFFRDMKLQRSNFQEAFFHRTQWMRCTLEESIGLSPTQSTTLFTACEPSDTFHLPNSPDTKLALLDGHHAIVRSCCYSPNGTLLASASDDCTLRLWDTQTWECLHVLRGHEGSILCCSFSSDGRLIASASTDGTVRLWDSVTGQCTTQLKGHSSSVTGCIFAPHSSFLLASSSSDKTLRLWDTTSGKCLEILEGHKAKINACAFSPDGTLLASGSDDKTIHLWNTATGQNIKTLQNQRHSVHGIHFSPDGHTIASASSDHSIVIWDSSTCEVVQHLKGHTDTVQQCAFSSENHILASASQDETLRIWNSLNGETLHILDQHLSSVEDVTFSPSGTQLASASSDHTVRIWNSKTGELIKTLRHHTSPLHLIACSPDNTYIVVATEFDTLHVFEKQTGKCQATLSGHQSFIRSIAFSDDGKYIASASADATVRIWETRTGKTVGILEHSAEVTFCSFWQSTDLHIISVSEDQMLRVWNSTSQRCIQQYSSPLPPIEKCFFNAQNGTLITLCATQKNVCWNMNNGKNTSILNNYTMPIQSATLSPNGQYLAISSGDAMVHLWDLKKDQLIGTFYYSDTHIQHCTFSADSQWIAIASDQRLSYWNPHTSECLGKFVGHQATILHCAFSPDGTELVSVSADGSLRIWNNQTQKETHFYVQFFENRAWASINPLHNYIIDTYGEMWYWLCWLIPDHNGAFIRYPAFEISEQE